MKNIECKNLHTIREELILPVGCQIVEIMLGNNFVKLIEHTLIALALFETFTTAQCLSASR